MKNQEFNANYVEVAILDYLENNGVTNVYTSVASESVQNWARKSQNDYWLFDAVCCRTGEVYSFCVRGNVARPANEESAEAVSKNIMINNELN